MKKIKNWLKNHKKFIATVLSILLSIWLFLAGFVVGSNVSQCNNIVNADTPSIYYIPSVTLTLVEYDNDINIVPIIAGNNGLPQENYSIAPYVDYRINDIRLMIEHSVRNTSPSQSFNVYFNGNYPINLTQFSFYIDTFVTTNINQSSIGNLFYFYCDYNVTCTVQYSLFNFSTGYFDEFIVNITPVNVDYYYDYSFKLIATENYISDELALVGGISITLFDFQPIIDPSIEFRFFSYSPRNSLTEIITSLPDYTIERVEVSVNAFASIVAGVDSVLSIEILPGFSFYTLIVICIAIPLLIAILKIYLGG